MQITREADYATRCVLHLSANPDKIVAVGEFVNTEDVPYAFAAKILQKLVKAGIVKSTQGVKGGFSLAKKPEQITLLDVYEAASGPLSLNICTLDKDCCDRSSLCPAHPVWVVMTDEVAKKLRQWNFKKLLTNYRKLNKPKNQPQRKFSR